MGAFRIARAGIALVILGLVVGAVTPVTAGQPVPCDVHKAASFRSAADRYVTERQYRSAASWYLAATRYTRGCGSPDAALLAARSLAQAGTAYAQGGDYGPALDLLQAAQIRFSALIAADHGAAKNAAEPYLEMVQNVISAVNRVAETMM